MQSLLRLVEDLRLNPAELLPKLRELGVDIEEVPVCLCVSARECLMCVCQ